MGRKIISQYQRLNSTKKRNDFFIKATREKITPNYKYASNA